MFYASKSDKIAVKDVCFTFEEGSLLALLGQNGAGKTTTMNVKQFSVDEAVECCL